MGESSSDKPKEVNCGRRVLIVEDTVSIRKLLVAILSQAQFDVVEAENGEEALGKINEAAPDVILSDIFMPVMDGRELLKRVRSAEGSPNVPVLMLSADFDPELEKEMLSLGAVKLLAKMGSRTELISTINNLIEAKAK